MTESWASSAATRASMRANRRRDTKPELAVRKLVHAAGLRYRVDHPPLDSHRRHRADLVFTRAKVAVFIDGCYWHGCPEHHRQPAANSDYWASKVAGNRDRDVRVTALLTEAGWTVLRFWEHEDPAVVAAAIVEAVRARRPTPPPGAAGPRP
ncbi:very short patch repair endonuclease [Mycobacteroides chelonae]|uniref:very short patch repair endonuclease n=1 Tax=Mycobacteroides chelonae TaxID=1774 RepID=UPI00099453F4|nr:very short patch repair endonuclease [Mycobacteroides chelonae]